MYGLSYFDCYFMVGDSFGLFQSVDNCVYFAVSLLDKIKQYVHVHVLCIQCICVQLHVESWISAIMYDHTLYVHVSSSSVLVSLDHSTLQLLAENLRISVYHYSGCVVSYYASSRLLVPH